MMTTVDEFEDQMRRGSRVIRFAAIVIVIAWKIIKGIVGLLVGVAIAGLIVYGGVKLLEGPRNG